MELNGKTGEMIRLAIERKIENEIKRLNNNLSFNKLERGIIEEININGYAIKINNILYRGIKAVSQNTSINVGDVVIVLIPNNQYTQMFILGKINNVLNNNGLYEHNIRLENYEDNYSCEIYLTIINRNGKKFNSYREIIDYLSNLDYLEGKMATGFLNNINVYSIYIDYENKILLANSKINKENNVVFISDVIDKVIPIL